MKHVSRGSIWRALFLAALVVPLFATANAQQSLPGVRNRIYESPAFGFTLVWDSSFWTPVESSSANGVDRLTLHSQVSVLQVDAVPKTESCQTRVSNAMSAILAGPGSHEVLIPPDASTARVRSVFTDAAGNVNDVTFHFQCNSPFGGDNWPFQVLFTHYTWTDRFDTEFTRAFWVIESLQPPASDWDPARGRTLGLLQFSPPAQVEASSDLTANAPLTFLTFDMVFENIDTYDSEIDAFRLWLFHSHDWSSPGYPVAGFAWLVAGNAQFSPVVTIPAGGSVVGRFTFVVPHDALDQLDLVYVDEQGDGATGLYAFGGRGGPGGRPRIDPGR